MIDHVILTVSDFKRSVAFYAKALKPLGITTFIDYEAAGCCRCRHKLCSLVGSTASVVMASKPLDELLKEGEISDQAPVRVVVRHPRSVPP